MKIAVIGTGIAGNVASYLLAAEQRSPAWARDALVEFGRDGERALTLLAELYDRDVLFRDPLQTLRGRDAFLTMNRRVLGRARRLSFDVKDVLGGRALWPNAAAATAPGGSLVALARCPLLALLVGAVAAPASYVAGARLGALALDGDRPRALAIIAIVWAAVLPAFFALRTHLGTRVLSARRPPCAELWFLGGRVLVRPDHVDAAVRSSSCT
jgi:hypothetical protein